MGYNEKQIEDMLNTNLLYQKKCINYKGKGTNKEYYIEFISKYIKKNEDKIKKSGELQYNESYVRKQFKFSHTPSEVNFNENSNQYERNLCIDLFKNGHDLKKLGKVVEYEVNIISGDHTNIDLISYNEQTGDLYLIEVKGTKDNNNKQNKNYTSPETLLRCILEISTYYNSIMPKRNEFKKGLEEKIHKKINNIKLAILLPDESEAYKEYSNKYEYTETKSLLKEPITIIGNEIKEIEVFSFTECNIPLKVKNK